jgi:hypothetical protein
MNAEQLFSLLNSLTLVAWVALIVLPRVHFVSAVLTVAWPAAMSVVYAVLIAWVLPASDGGFSSVAAVRTLFANDWALLAGWTHYLAFDLLIGGWEVRDAQSRGIRHLLVVPALLLTFLVGPAGFLLYLAIRRLGARPGAQAVPR